MFTMDVGMSSGSVSVETTEHRGFTTEEIAKRACEKIISISEGTDPVLKAQAEAFKQRMYYVIVQACQDAILSNQTTLHNMLSKQGHEDMADIIRRL